MARQPVAQFLLLLAALPGAPAAQEPTGRLSGRVVDSLLSVAPLVDAEVWIDGTTLTARTDEDGRYRFDAVPRGRHRVTVYHPALTAAGIGSPVRTVVVPAGREVRLDLATPSGHSVFRSVCRRAAHSGEGVFLGRVREVGTDSVAGGARVAALWTDFSLDGTRVSPSRRALEALTGADGTFVLCGVPREREFMVEASAAAGSFGVSAMTLRGRVAHAAELGLPPRPAGIAGAAATVQGRVVDEMGQPLEDVEIVLDEIPDGLRTSLEGRFRLAGLVPGRHVVTARRLGFAPLSVQVALAQGEAIAVELRLLQSAVQLAPIEVAAAAPARPGAFDVSGYERRRNAGVGIFLEREELDRGSRLRLGDALAGVPGVRVDVRTAFPLLDRGIVGVDGCIPILFVDGVRQPNSAYFLESSIFATSHPSEIEAVEIYRGLHAPVEFRSPLDMTCGTIVVWRRNAAVPR